MAKRLKELGEAELEILRVLWSAGSATVRDVLTALHDQGRKVAYTTVLTTLSRLEQKGYVTSNKSGMAYVYRAKVTRQRVTRARLDALIEQLFDGVPGSLVMTLMQTEEFSREELSEFQRVIDGIEADTDADDDDDQASGPISRKG